ncbi:hypothetical protein [Phorcysia thermohydrogeniphila]|uniref:Cytochrome c oxidase subunit IIa family protein n=1 Tax=Phorcysia thermohydrogeniphila TaxID=936138 RepID=A0A4V2PDW2_9BACT|nr:hypothetical protein [Phorcysia thermohydrogeniphila]TCK06446.1 hypothetical protein CLV27_0247 [Phorcysia thermohydrogeniphila]
MGEEKYQKIINIMGTAIAVLVILFILLSFYLFMFTELLSR